MLCFFSTSFFTNGETEEEHNHKADHWGSKKEFYPNFFSLKKNKQTNKSPALQLSSHFLLFFCSLMQAPCNKLDLQNNFDQNLVIFSLKFLSLESFESGQGRGGKREVVQRGVGVGGGGSGGWDQDRQVVARQSSNAINDSIHIHHMVTSHDTKPQHQTQTL